MPPSAMTVWALPSRDLQTRPTDPRGGGFDGGPQARPSGPDHEHVVPVRLVLGHQRSLTSDQIPRESIRT